MVKNALGRGVLGAAGPCPPLCKRDGKRWGQDCSSQEGNGIKGTPFKPGVCFRGAQLS